VGRVDREHAGQPLVPGRVALGALLLLQILDPLVELMLDPFDVVDHFLKIVFTFHDRTPHPAGSAGRGVTVN
jgi:hypothetical protein